MTYVDDAAIMYHGKPRFHMTADTRGELHVMAEMCGVKRCWFHKASVHPHYDITEEQRAAAVRLGAREVSQRQLSLLAKELAHAKF